MELNFIKIIETIIILMLYFISRGVCARLIDKTLSDKLVQKARGTIIKRAIFLVLLSISLIFILIIWGVKQSDIAVFAGSVLTVIGVALFAQWSLLSNITSSIIIFFNHSVKINDSIIILESKDYVIEGKVLSIGLFFTTLITSESEEITLPNNIFIQKSIKKKTEV